MRAASILCSWRHFIIPMLPGAWAALVTLLYSLLTGPVLAGDYDPRDRRDLDALIDHVIGEDYPEPPPIPHRRHGDPYGHGPRHVPHGAGIDHTRGFGWLFEGLPPHKSPARDLVALARLMIEHPEEEHHGGNSRMPAGYTFLGQFIDHDLTFDSSSLEEAFGDKLENARTPDLDLDPIYAGGPDRAPHLYNLPYLRVGPEIGPGRYDLLRTEEIRYPGPIGGRALGVIGDPRNDENLIIAQIHAAFIAFHNRAVDRLVWDRHRHLRAKICTRRSHCSPALLAEALPRHEKREIFELARDHTIHYYHRIIAEDFLPRVIGYERTVDLFKNGRDFFFPRHGKRHAGPWKRSWIPVEFAMAAFRYGHSQVRYAYRLNGHVHRALFPHPGERGKKRGLAGKHEVSGKEVIDWRYFFAIDPVPPEGFNWSRKLDRKITESLHHLDLVGALGEGELGSLPARNMIRGAIYRLPPGQAVAREILPVLAKRGVLSYWDEAFGFDGDWRAYWLPESDLVRRTLGKVGSPLWYYILHEAELFGLPSSYPSVLLKGDPFKLSHYEGVPPHDLHLAADVPHKRHGAYGPKYKGRYKHDRAIGGHTLGPVGGTIVGEVLTGLIDHYRETTGKGLDFKPIYGADDWGVEGRKTPGGHFTMREFLIAAGVVY